MTYRYETVRISAGNLGIQIRQDDAPYAFIVLHRIVKILFSAVNDDFMAALCQSDANFLSTCFKSTVPCRDPSDPNYRYLYPTTPTELMPTYFNMLLSLFSNNTNLIFYIISLTNISFKAKCENKCDYLHRELEFFFKPIIWYLAF